MALVLAGGATLAAILFLFLSVWPADFRYVATEPLLRTHVDQVRPEAGPEKESGEIALAALKALLVRQYAEAAQNNRAINLRRAAWRTRAGLAILVSVLAILVLAALPVLSDRHAHGPSQTNPCPDADAGKSRPAAHQPGAAAGHDGRAQGLVPRDGAARHRAPGEKP